MADLSSYIHIAANEIIAGNISSDSESNISVNSLSNIDITSNGNSWVFDTTGNLTVPGIIIGAGNSKLDMVTDGPNTAYLGTTESDDTALYLTASEAQLYANTYVNITAGKGGTSQFWTFDGNGNLTFPNGAIFTGSDLYAAANSYVEFATNDGNTFMGVGTDGAFIQTDWNGAQRQWSFSETGNLTLPNGALIKDTAGNSVVFGQNAGQTSQGANAVAIGFSAGNETQGVAAVAIGALAGTNSQRAGAVAVGIEAGSNTQGSGAVAVGTGAGYTGQGVAAVGVGGSAGQTGQGGYSVAIGFIAGQTGQGANAVAIGHQAGATNQGNNSIILNATGSALDQTTANTFTVAPVRNDIANIAQVMFYNTTSKEVTYGNTLSVAGDISANNVTATTFIGSLTGEATSATTAGTVTNAVQTNITRVGTLASLSVAGNITGANFVGVGAGSPTITSTAYLDLNPAIAVRVVGGGELTATGNITAPQFISTIATGTAPFVVTSTTRVANLNVATAGTAGTATFATTASSVTNPSQGSITSVGALSSLFVVGSATVGSLGTTGFISTTTTVNAGTGITTGGTVGATGTITGGNLSTGGTVSATGTITGGNLTTGGTVGATGTITGGNLSTGGTVSATGTITGGNLTTGGKLTFPNGTVIKDTAGYAVAFGLDAGATTQGDSAIAIGSNAGKGTQGVAAVAVGSGAGQTGQGAYSVAIGSQAGATNQGNNSIILNATDSKLNQTTANTFTVAPVRNDTSNIAQVMFYNTTSKEVTYGNTISVAGNITAGNISGNTNGFTIGYLTIPQIAAANATLALTDAGKHYYSTSTDNFTLTIPTNASVAFATGTTIDIVVQSLGNILVNATSGVTLYMAGVSTAANRTVGGYGMATLMKVGTDTWFIKGTGVV